MNSLLKKYLNDFKILKKINIRNIHLSFFFIFMFINWIIQNSVTDFANPDFYKYLAFGKDLIKFNFSEGLLIPPLHPVLMIITGKFLGIFIVNGNSYILSARIISLISTLFLIYFTHRFLSGINRKMADMGIYYIFLSAVFLKFLNWPLTDLFFLTFLMITFYFLFDEDKKSALSNAILSFLIRFEGVLVLASYFFYRLKLNKKKFLFLILFSFLILSDFLFIASKLAGRVFVKLQYVFSNGRIIYFISHPETLFFILKKNFLYFFQSNFSNTFLTIFLFIYLVIFIFGIQYIYKLNRKFMGTIFSFIFLYLLSKGYVIDAGRELLHTRRLLPVLFFFQLFFIIGLYSVYIKTRRILRGKTQKILIILITIILINIIDYSKVDIMLLFFLFCLIIILSIAVMREFSVIQVIAFIVCFASFSSGFYSTSQKVATKFLNASAAKGSYVISNWINYNNISNEEKIWVFSHPSVVKFYCKNQENIIFKRYPAYIKGTSMEKYKNKFYNKVKQLNVKYVLFDGYIMPGYDKRKINIKRILLKERKQNSFFKLGMDLFFKGKPAATVLIPK